MVINNPMSWLIIIWSMIAAACGMLGLIQLFFWLHNRRDRSYSLSAVMAFSAMVVGLLEIQQFSTPDPAHFQTLMVWQQVPIAMVVVAMVWFVRQYLTTARGWLAVLITGLWCAGMMVNVFLPGSLPFSEVVAMDVRTTFWGEPFFVPSGIPNPWKLLGDVTIILIPLYIIDASARALKQGSRERSVVIIGGVLVFIIFAGVHSMLVDAEIVRTPYMISAGFLAIVGAQTWVLARDAVRARDELEQRVEERTAELAQRNELFEKANKKMKRDLDAAANVQQALLPKGPFEHDRVQIAWKYRPSDELGGDSLNFFRIDDRHLAMFILDVTGHGVPAALLSVSVTHALSVGSDTGSGIRTTADDTAMDIARYPRGVAAALNHRFPMKPEAGLYFTLVYGVLDTFKNQFCYVSAGQYGPIHFRPPESSNVAFSTGAPIGVFEDSIFEQEVIQLQPGDRLFLHSDGLMEERNPAGEQFGVERIQRLIEEGGEISLPECVNGLERAVLRWRGSENLTDDLTILALELRPGLSDT